MVAFNKKKYAPMISLPLYPYEIGQTAAQAIKLPDNQDITLPDVFQTVLELIPIPEGFSNNLGRTIDVIKPHRLCSQAATPNGPPEQFPRPMAMPPGERIYSGARFRFDARPRSGGPRLTAPLHLMGPRQAAGW